MPQLSVPTLQRAHVDASWVLGLGIATIVTGHSAVPAVAGGGSAGETVGA
jgi:hypothetical protein